MIRRPPSSPLFPYPPLFGSWHGSGRSARRRGAGRQGMRGAASRLDLVRRLDRKSTRLNSSHSQISYAVFCLKKKITVGSFVVVDVNTKTAMCDAVNAL